MRPTLAQPAGGVPANVLGIVVRSNKALDCAVCRLGTRSFLLEIYGLSGPGGSPTPARIGMKLVKSGLSTGVTWGHRRYPDRRIHRGAGHVGAGER